LECATYADDGEILKYLLFNFMKIHRRVGNPVKGLFQRNIMEKDINMEIRHEGVVAREEVIAAVAFNVLQFCLRCDTS
jgi:hypothetical protein